MPRRELALTVFELEKGEYYWVIMEAVQAESEELLNFTPADSAMRPSRNYQNAMMEGMVALRVAQGLAPFGRPPIKAGLGDILDEVRLEDLDAVDSDR